MGEKGDQSLYSPLKGNCFLYELMRHS